MPNTSAKRVIRPEANGQSGTRIAKPAWMRGLQHPPEQPPEPPNQAARQPTKQPRHKSKGLLALYNRFARLHNQARNIEEYNAAVCRMLGLADHTPDGATYVTTTQPTSDAAREQRNTLATIGVYRVAYEISPASIVTTYCIPPSVNLAGSMTNKRRATNS